jgi:hypothetical protein
LICASLQADFELYLEQGPSAVKYGDPDLWKRTLPRVSSIFGQKSSREEKNILKSASAPVSDRRPPDTNDTLAKGNEQLSRKIRIRQKKAFVEALGGGTWTKKTKLQDVKESGGSPVRVAAKNKDAPVLLHGYQSYPHKANSCYITAPLEVLYTAYLRDWTFWDGFVNTLPDGFGLKLISESFTMRDKAKNSHPKMIATVSEVEYFNILLEDNSHILIFFFNS